jgi:hypothetical protein
MVMLLTAVMAERARLVELNAPTELDEAEFVANLADMIVGGVEAPRGASLEGTART